MTMQQLASVLQWLSTVAVWAVAAHVMWPVVKHRKFNKGLTPILLAIEQKANATSDPGELLALFNQINQVWEKDKKRTNTANDMRIVGILAYIKGRWDQHNLQHGRGLSLGNNEEESFSE